MYLINISRWLQFIQFISGSWIQHTQSRKDEGIKEIMDTVIEECPRKCIRLLLKLSQFLFGFIVLVDEGI